MPYAPFVRWAGLAALCFAGALACSHDWDIVPPSGADAGGVKPNGSGTVPSSSVDAATSSKPPPPPPPKKCPADCTCGAGQTCNFECDGDCMITCEAKATCNIEAAASCTVSAPGKEGDCSNGHYTCKASPNGKDIQCSKQ